MLYTTLVSYLNKQSRTRRFDYVPTKFGMQGLSFASLHEINKL